MAMQALSHLQNFTANTKLKQATMAFISSQVLSKAEKEEMDKIFRALDSQGSGMLKPEDIMTGYKEIFDVNLSIEDINEIFEKVDTDRSGHIDYSEFLQAAISQDRLLSVKKLQMAFDMFDKD